VKIWPALRWLRARPGQFHPGWVGAWSLAGSFMAESDLAEQQPDQLATLGHRPAVPGFTGVDKNVVFDERWGIHRLDGGEPLGQCG